MPEPRVEISPFAYSAPPADRMVISHWFHLLIGGMVSNWSITLFIEPKKNLYAGKARHGFVEIQPVGSISELLTFSGYDGVAFGLWIHEEACLHEFGVPMEITSRNVYEFRPRSILDDAGMHDHDSSTLIEPLDDRLALIHGQALAEVGGVVEQNEIIVFQVACAEFVSALGDADVDVVFCAQGSEVAVDAGNFRMSIPRSL